MYCSVSSTHYHLELQFQEIPHPPPPLPWHCTHVYKPHTDTKTPPPSPCLHITKINLFFLSKKEYSPSPLAPEVNVWPLMASLTKRCVVGSVCLWKALSHLHFLSFRDIFLSMRLFLLSLSSWLVSCIPL